MGSSVYFSIQRENRSEWGTPLVSLVVPANVPVAEGLHSSLVFLIGLMLNITCSNYGNTPQSKPLIISSFISPSLVL